MKKRRRFLGVLLAVLMAASVFPAFPIGASAAITPEEYEVVDQAYNGDGIINTFIGEKLSDKKIITEEEAYDFVMSMIDRIGGDSTTELELAYTRQNANGMAIVTFSQQAGPMLVYGAAVKLIIDKDDYPIGIVSSIMPNVQIRPIDEWALDEDQAEQIVKEQLKKAGSKDEVVEGAGERVIIPAPDSDGRFVCAWVIYSYNKNKGRDDYAYNAHYVTADGDYLYSIAVSQPGDPDAETGQTAKETFDFDKYEKDELTVSVDWHDGTTRDITVPVLNDAASGKIYLADAERKILCADMATFMFDDTIAPMEVQDGADPIDVSTYSCYIRIYDIYKEMGWEAPDGKGTPSLLLMNYVDQNGEPEYNACYISKIEGFQTFVWTRVKDFGQCTDIVGHEYTHCVTSNAMLYNLYRNDPGAINEGFSDIMGSLIEIMLDGRGEGSWIVGENTGSAIRFITDPHKGIQPEYAFDLYYAPNAAVPSGMNDRGGVHTNASLLCNVAYKLDQAGMSPSDNAYFWLNAALFMSPQSDYPMMAAILPWVLKQLGYDEYLDVLEQAIEESKFTVTEDPEIISEGCGAVTFDFADIKDLADNGRVQIFLIDASTKDYNKRISSWPGPGTTVARLYAPAGEYYVMISISDPSGEVSRNLCLTKDGWKLIGDDISKEEFDSMIIPVTVKEGETIVLTNDNFLEAAAELLKIVDPEYVLEIPAETPSGDKNPDTGDAQDMSLWIITVFISGFAAFILIVPCRRRRVSKAE